LTTKNQIAGAEIVRTFATILFLALSGCTSGGNSSFRAGDFLVRVGDDGFISAFESTGENTDYLADQSPLLQIRKRGVLHPPHSASIRGDSIRLVFEGGSSAVVQVSRRTSHLRFDLIDVTSADEVELVVWGPYKTRIGKTIGETVGVVRGESYSIGLQALNAKTLGGFPWNENDAMPQLDIFESGDFSDLSEEGKRHVLYRVEAAKPDSFGSTLQAYTRNRNRERVIPNWGHERYVAPPFDDGGVIGSAIALFGAPVEKALNAVGKIELAEDLPHPLIEGAWAKSTPAAAAAYVILEFGESNIDAALDVVEAAGLDYLYHPGPFETWGHFRLNPSFFPGGDEGLRRAVDRARERGIMVGVHTLSNFITTNDPYVTPRPDSRLARVGSSSLTRSASRNAAELNIADPAFFNQFENNHLRAAALDNEIVQYEGVSESPPWKLIGVKRGAFGTSATEHEAGTIISKLADHGYRVFLSNADLTMEMSGRLAELFNRTGLRQISFDGLEGNRSTGMGNYGEILFTQTWFDRLSGDIRSHYVADASRTSHFFWHVYTRMNWGEPWYAGFRESQTEYRLKNQAYFRRNMMPGMLGWFRMTASTSIEDIEWMLARSAAFDAGYALVTSFEALEQNGLTPVILSTIGRWEEARMAGAFTSEQKHRMENVSHEFELREQAGAWTLTQVDSYKARHEVRERQPGEPSHSVLAVENRGRPQPLRFTLRAESGPLVNVRFTLDVVRDVPITGTLASGEILSYGGGTRAEVFSEEWQPLRSVAIDPELLSVAPGEHSLSIDADFEGRSAVAVLEVRMSRSPEPVMPSD
jgi:hypothetical protein